MATDSEQEARTLRDILSANLESSVGLHGDVLKYDFTDDPPTFMYKVELKVTVTKTRFRGCDLDTDCDGNCSVHPTGCPK